MKDDISRRVEQFITEEQQFHLGFLPTEQSNPLTRSLSSDYAEDTKKGVRTLQRVDREVLKMARNVLHSEQYKKLYDRTYTTIMNGGRIIFSGCGATGRLSIMLECMWREACAKNPAVAKYADQVESIMTGGDYALVKSVEFFEDYAVFGRRQVQEANMGPQDTLVAITEGGETSSVLGTVAEALDRGCAVFLLFNNPADLLAKHLERSRKAIEDPRVTVLDLYCGPMGLAGSTRMQATTSEQLVAGAALEATMQRLLGLPERDYVDDFEKMLASLETDQSVETIAKYTEFEAGIYREKGKLTYFADDFLLDIFTDTTERSPTFMLPPFRKCDDKVSPQPWTFVKNPLCSTPEVWDRGMHRALRCLDWKPADYEAMGTADKIGNNPPKISAPELLKFMVGQENVEERWDSGKDAAVLVELSHNEKLEAAFDQLAPKFAHQAKLTLNTAIPGAFSVDAYCDGGALELMRHLALKLVLNNISTGTMAVLGRVTGNWMSWVDCTNKKLLDRGARLLVEIGKVDYRTALSLLFEAMDHLKHTRGEKPSPVQVALQWLQRPKINSLKEFQKELKPSWLLMMGPENPFAVTPADMAAHDIVAAEDGMFVVDVWHGHPTLGEDFTVRAEWTQTDDGRYAGRLSYNGLTGKTFITEIQFPLISVSFDVDAKILTGEWDMGFTFDAKIITAGQYDIKRTMESMQFGAILRPHGQSVYYDFRDPEWNLKQVRLALSKDRIMTVAGVYLCPLGDVPAEEGGVPYECDVKLFEGGWYQAAQIYRPWALQQSWVTNRPKNNPLRDIDFWFWNRGLVKDVVPPVEQLKKDCPEAKLALDWYWWHTNPYDTDYPFFWPPREGEETFRAAVKRLKEQDIYTQVYVNGVCWDCDADTWTQGGDRDVVKLPNGDLRAHAFNKYNNHRLAWMCGEAPHHHDKISELLGHLHDCGLSGQYLDMIGCATYGPCYNPDHKHPKGGGHYMRDGYRKMLQRLKDEYPDYPLTTETANEAYMDLCDGGIICTSASIEHMGNDSRNMVPLFSAVYHGSFALFGNYAHPDGVPPWDPKWPSEDKWPEEKDWNSLYPDQFFVEMARPIVWGVQPMVCHLRSAVYTEPKYHDVYQFIVDTAKFYHDHKDFLFDGTMMSPDGFSCDEKEVSFLARMIFTKQAEARVITKTLPCVLHGHWRNPKGEYALILANYTADAQSWSFRGKSGIIAAHSYECIKL